MKKIITFLTLINFSVLFAQVSITANLPTQMVANSKFTTEVKIVKGELSNFAKYQIDVPLGYVITPIDIKGGNFTFENQRAKLVWVSLPADDFFSISYQIEVNSSAADTGILAQKFYYLENNEKKEVETKPVTVTIGAIQISTVNGTSAQPNSVTSVNTSVVSVSNPSANTSTSNSSTLGTSNNTSSNASVSNEQGLSYRVQIGSFAAEPSKSKFSKIGKVYIDLINGAYKVTAGNFSARQDAVLFRDELQAKGFPGFIIVLKNGQRVN
jgi:cell division septation protein DedD